MKHESMFRYLAEGTSQQEIEYAIATIGDKLDVCIDAMSRFPLDQQKKAIREFLRKRITNRT